MAKFLICTISVIGHVSPALPIAREIVDRGHQVYWYTSGKFQAKVESTGAHFTPAVALSPEWLAQWMARRNALQGVAQLKFDLKHGFIDAAVRQVKDLTEIPCVERELMLIKVHAAPASRSEIIEIAQIFRARVVDVSDDSLILEVVGDPGKMVAIIKMLEKFGIREIARTGKISLIRESGVNTEYLKVT